MYDGGKKMEISSLRRYDSRARYSERSATDSVTETFYARGTLDINYR